MRVEVIGSPRLLSPEHLTDRTVIVLDVLRATTTMIAALHAGCREIRVFAELEETRRAAAAYEGPKLLCGERGARPPVGFDLGNSPGDFVPERVAGHTLFMTTTNGTPAILSSARAATVLVGAVCNATALAKAALRLGRDLTILCAGQRGDVALEDLLGAGALIDRLRAFSSVELLNDSALIAESLYTAHRDELGTVFQCCRGARSELLRGLAGDIDYCAVIDRFDVIGVLNGLNRVQQLSV